MSKTLFKVVVEHVTYVYAEDARSAVVEAGSVEDSREFWTNTDASARPSMAPSDEAVSQARQRMAVSLP